MSKDNLFYKKTTIKVSGKILSLEKPLIMGIINLTDDSFFAGSRSMDKEAVLRKAEGMLAEGADILDLGACSSRPGAPEIPLETEWERLKAVIEPIKTAHPESVISIDTVRSEIAERAVKAGADIINDISGGHADQRMFETVGRLKVPYILMHMKGNPSNMQQLTQYDNLLSEISYYFSEKIINLKKFGVDDIIIDPGFGFAKNLGQNYSLLKNLHFFQLLERPLLVGISRKSMIYKKLGTTAAEALNGTTALHMFALTQGANILRVHDIKEAKETVLLFEHLKN